jgi:asparagine synthase (glutamine-hydrolysing)
MCGITGLFSPSLAQATRRPAVERMLAALAHRGPDDSGVYEGTTVTFGAARLEIIDRAGGRQPLSNEDGTLWVTFNGEIYNHVALRAELQGRGHRFRSTCDTEVIVHAWEEWGAAAIDRFEGMFAFGLWDIRTSTLVLVRDRLGVKPLYYAGDGDQLLFGSEIKAILASGLVEPEVDLQSVYYQIGYEFVPAPATMFKGVHKVPAGHLVRVSAGTVAVEKYWDIRFEPVTRSRDEWIEGIRARLSDAVAKRLMAEVPLGVFLSGGVDSTAVLALARRSLTRPIPTFTLGYADGSFSEWEHARRAARYYGTDHHEVVIPPITPEQIERVVWHFDEPMTEFSAVALFVLCEKAREHVTVCLSGEGNDELFVGYDRFIASKLNTALYRRLPSSLRHGLVEPLVARLSDQAQKKGAVNKLKRFVEGAALPEDGGHMRWQYFSSAAHDEAIFSPSFLAGVRRDAFEPLRRCRENAGRIDRLSLESYVDLRFTMPESVLMKVDKMSMAHGLEVRVPFLDHALVEYVAGLPSALKFPGFRTKAIYREAMRGILPDFVLDRAKQGYSIPIKNWLRTDLSGYLSSVLSGSPFIREQFRLEYVNHLVGQHARRTHNHSHVLWALLNIALWHRRFIESPSARAA